MTLVLKKQSFYSISMKTFLTTFITLLCTPFFVAAGYAQTGKMLKQAAKAATQKPAVSVNQVSAPISHAAQNSTALLNAVQAAVPLGNKPDIPSVAPIRLSDEQKYQQEVAAIMNFSLDKKLLNYAYDLEKERSSARRLAMALQKYQTLNLTKDQTDNLVRKMDGFLVNNSLRNYLKNSVTNKNYKQFMRDLSNYYSLSVKFLGSYELRFIANQDAREIFAQTALDYMQMHPHKMNLKLREIMKSPAVSDEVKSTLRGFIALDKILPQHESAFLTVLREAHRQHTAGLAAARSEENVAETVKIYKDTLAELKDFIKRYNRSPRWNAPVKERRMYNKLLLLITHNQANHFKQVESYIDQIEQLLTEYPRIRLNAEQTITQLRLFVAKNHRLPRAITEAPEGSIPEKELELYESVFYWEGIDENFSKELALIRRISLKK